MALSRSSGVFVKVRFLDLVRCSERDPFAIDFDTPGGRSGSVTLRVPGGFANAKCSKYSEYW